MTDPTLRADLIAFLENSKGRVRLSTPDYVPMCSAVLPCGERCGADRDLPGQGYCRECRQSYRGDRLAAARNKFSFHDDAKQVLRAYRFLRRRANQAEAA